MYVNGNEALTMRCVAYYRVSTDKQGKSGLGLEAQRQIVQTYLNSHQAELIEEFTDTASGRKRDRAKLSEALDLARKQKATLVVAKLDRLSRSTLHLLQMVEEARVPVAFCDFPEVSSGSAGRFFLTMLAGAAEFEANLISERTKAALAAAKARGTILGANGKVLAQQNREAAIARAASVADRLKSLRSAGMSVRAMAHTLTDEGTPTPSGGNVWHPTTVYRALKHINV